MIYAIYDMEDNLIGVFDNYKELAKFFNRSEKSIQSTLSRYFSGKLKTIVKDKKHYKIYKIRE